MRKRQEEIETILTKNYVVWFLALLCCLLWGSAFPCIKIGYGLFEIGADDTASQIAFAGCRFTLAGLFVIIMGSIAGRRLLLPKKSSLHMIGTLSLFQTLLQYLFFYVGLAHTTGVKASIITGTNVFVAILVAVFLFHQEKLTSEKCIGCLLGFVGVVLANMGGDGWNLDFRINGEGFLFISAIAYAFSSVLIKKYSAKESPLLLSGYQFLAGGLVMMVLGFLAGGKMAGTGMQNIGMLAYLAFISAGAYTLWGILLKYNPVSKVTVFGFMNPVFGVLLSALLLGEAKQAAMPALGFVCAGILIVNKGSALQE